MRRHLLALTLLAAVPFEASATPAFCEALNQVEDGAAYLRALQQAGYATDPAYADKLSRIINGPTLRQALIG